MVMLIDACCTWSFIRKQTDHVVATTKFLSCNGVWLVCPNTLPWPCKQWKCYAFCYESISRDCCLFEFMVIFYLNTFILEPDNIVFDFFLAEHEFVVEDKAIRRHFFWGLFTWFWFVWSYQMNQIFATRAALFGLFATKRPCATQVICTSSTSSQFALYVSQYKSLPCLTIMYVMTW